MTNNGKEVHELVDQFRIILMDEDTDCGNEVLCTLIAIKHAKIVLEASKKELEVINSYEYRGFTNDRIDTIDCKLAVLDKM